METLETEEMTVKIIGWEDAGEVERMEDFVRRHEKSHFLQTPSWARVKEYWKWRGVLVLCGGQVIGAVSLLIRPLPLGYSVIYAPRGPVCDRKDPWVLSALLSGANQVARQFHAIELLADPDEPDTNENFRKRMKTMGFEERGDTAFDNVQAQYVFRLPLAGRTAEEVFQGFCQKTRYNIRLAQRKDVQIRIFPGDREIPDEELLAFNHIMEETAQRDHFIPRPLPYYQKVFRELKGEVVLFMAYLEGIPIAGTIGVYSGAKGWYLYGASSNQHRNAMPNYLLQWKMVQTAMERKCVFYDFRGVPGILTQENPLYGLYRFKKGFGGDYTQFTGLFLRRYKPVLAKCFSKALRLYRILRARIHCK